LTTNTKKKTGKKKATATKDGLPFEAAMQELEELVSRMEQGDHSLEASLKDFERGVELTRICQKALAEAEQKVQILSKNLGQDDDLEHYDPESEDPEF